MNQTTQGQIVGVDVGGTFTDLVLVDPATQGATGQSAQYDGQPGLWCTGGTGAGAGSSE